MLRLFSLIVTLCLPVIAYGSHQAIVDRQSAQLRKFEAYPNFSDSPYLTNWMRKQMAPHLLPQQDPKKKILDTIFADPTVTTSEKALRKGGFRILFSQKRSGIRVISHPELRGYLIKLFLGAEERFHHSGWMRLTTRCQVAKKIRSLIKRHALHHFAVADKWLYPLPHDPSHRQKQPVVLVVKDMKIYNREKAKQNWQQQHNRAILRELYQVLGRGFGSAFLSGNVPYSPKNKKFVFIDTEYAKRKIPLEHVKKFLSGKMCRYWDRLVKRHHLKTRIVEQ